jgi:hypothetical protein
VFVIFVLRLSQITSAQGQAAFGEVFPSDPDQVGRERQRAAHRLQRDSGGKVERPQDRDGEDGGDMRKGKGGNGGEKVGAKIQTLRK